MAEMCDVVDMYAGHAVVENYACLAAVMLLVYELIPYKKPEATVKKLGCDLPYEC